MTNPNEDFEDLYKNLDGKMAQQRKLVNIKMSLDRENVKEDTLKQIFEEFPDKVKYLYKDFESRM